MNDRVGRRCVLIAWWAIIAPVGGCAAMDPQQDTGTGQGGAQLPEPVQMSLKIYKVSGEPEALGNLEAGTLQLPLETTLKPYGEPVMIRNLQAVYLPGGRAHFVMGGKAPISESPTDSAPSRLRKAAYESFGLLCRVFGVWGDDSGSMDLKLDVEMSESKTKYILSMNQTIQMGRGEIFELKASDQKKGEEGDQKQAEERFFAVVELSESGQKGRTASTANSWENVTRMELLVFSTSCPADKATDFSPSDLIAGDPDEKDLMERLARYGRPAVIARLASLVDITRESSILMGDTLPTVQNYRWSPDGTAIPSITYEDVGCIFDFGPSSWTRKGRSLRCMLPVKLELSGVHPSGVKTESMPVALPSFDQLTVEQVFPLVAGQPRYHVWFHAPRTREDEMIATVTVARLTATPK